MRVGIYKRSQGRITRQVTFAALALTIALGLLRLSTVLVGFDPIVTALPARVTCTAKAGHVEADANDQVDRNRRQRRTVAVQRARRSPRWPRPSTPDRKSHRRGRRR